jgi:hypothetical protein
VPNTNGEVNFTNHDVFKLSPDVIFWLACKGFVSAVTLTEVAGGVLLGVAAAGLLVALFSKDDDKKKEKSSNTTQGMSAWD